jgi:hypothetical protein
MKKLLFCALVGIVLLCAGRSAFAGSLTFTTIGYDFPVFSAGSAVVISPMMKTYVDINGTVLMSKPITTSITVDPNHPNDNTFHWFGVLTIGAPIQIKWSITQLVSDGVNSTNITITGMAFVTRLGTTLSFDHSTISFSLGGQNYTATYSYTGGPFDPNSRGGVFATADPKVSISAVPEPSTWAMMLSGMVFLAAIAIYHKKFSLLR